MPKKSPVTVYVCSACDRHPARVETPLAEGRSFLAEVKKRFKTDAGVRVCAVKCLGGCVAGGTPNGCCSVGFNAPGMHGYLFNKLNPATDGWKLAEFLKLYLKRPNGRIYCRESARGDELRPHLALRLPPPKAG